MPPQKEMQPKTKRLRMLLFLALFAGLMMSVASYVLMWVDVRTLRAAAAPRVEAKIRTPPLAVVEEDSASDMIDDNATGTIRKPLAVEPTIIRPHDKEEKQKHQQNREEEKAVDHPPSAKNNSNVTMTAAAAAASAGNNSNVTTTTATTHAQSLPEKREEKSKQQLTLAFGACCGIGHRMSRVIPTLVYAKTHGMMAFACWSDVPWNEIFNDTSTVRQGTSKDRNAGKFYGNGWPDDWNANSSAESLKLPDAPGEVLKRYGSIGQQSFLMPEAQEIVAGLRSSLSSRVLKKLDPIRNRFGSRRLKFAAHFRLGNHETGDWENKAWRHVNDPVSIMNATLRAMIYEAKTQESVSVFIASDSPDPIEWFRDHLPNGWDVFDQADTVATKNNDTMAISRPQQGVWFGEHGSKTGANLTREETYERMAEGYADAFALGEGVDALFVPTYSSFTFIPIILASGRNKRVLFRSGVAFTPLPLQHQGQSEEGRTLESVVKSTTREGRQPGKVYLRLR